MSDIESCSIQQLRAHARGMGERNALNDASSRFASYLRVLAIFFRFTQ
jgi:hypothetical protein